MIRICLGCNEPFDADHPWGRVCPPCKEHWRRWLTEKLRPLSPPGTDPLRRLYCWTFERAPRA